MTCTTGSQKVETRAISPRHASSSHSRRRDRRPGERSRCSPRPAEQLLDWSWKSRLKVQQLGPKRRDLNASHLLVHRAHLRLKGIPLVGSDTLSRGSEVFGRYAIHYIDGGSASYEQNMRRGSVLITGECHLRICFQCRHFGRVRNRT